MRHEIHTEIEVSASAPRVWRVLTDGTALPSWNPVLTRLDGPLEVGRKVRVDIRTGGRRLPLRVKLSIVRPDEALEWAGGLPGVFSARHGFRIEPVGDEEGRVRFVHYEYFDGIAIRPLRRILASLEKDYVTMNEALRDYAESTVVDGRRPT